MSQYQTWSWQQHLAAQYPAYYSLADYAGINAVDAYGRTRLMHAAALADHAKMQNLLAAGANPDLQAIYASSSGALHYAGLNALAQTIEKDDVIGARLLLAEGANPNAVLFYTDPGMGNYTRRMADFLAPHQHGMRALLASFGTDMRARGELAKMRCSLRP